MYSSFKFNTESIAYFWIAIAEKCSDSSGLCIILQQILKFSYFFVYGQYNNLSYAMLFSVARWMAPRRFQYIRDPIDKFENVLSMYFKPAGCEICCMK